MVAFPLRPVLFIHSSHHAFLADCNHACFHAGTLPTAPVAPPPQAVDGTVSRGCRPRAKVPHPSSLVARRRLNARKEGIHSPTTLDLDVPSSSRSHFSTPSLSRLLPPSPLDKAAAGQAVSSLPLPLHKARAGVDRSFTWLHYYNTSTPMCKQDHQAIAGLVLL